MTDPALHPVPSVKEDLQDEKRDTVVFIVSPIGDAGSPTRQRADNIRKYIIDPAAKDAGFARTIRADEISEPGVISRQIVERLMNADAVVADISGLNANVFYEIAIRHAVRRPAIHLYERADEIPFDVKDIRAVRVGLDITVVEQAKSDLTALLHHICENPREEMTTPFTEALRLDSAIQSAVSSEGPAIARILEELAGLRDAVESMQVRERRPRAATQAPLGSPATLWVRAPDQAHAGERVDVDVVVLFENNSPASGATVEGEVASGFFTSWQQNATRTVAQADIDGIASFEVQVPFSVGATVQLAFHSGAAAGLATIEVVEPEELPF